MWTINHQQINEQGRLKEFVANYPQLNFACYEDPLPSHAIVLHGQEPANLLLYSEHLIRRILCDNHTVDQEPCGQCEACLAYLRGNSERFIHLFPQGAAISIAQVREMVAKLDLKLENGKKQIVVLYFPAQMQKEAANAILKTLEEPPEGRVFFLINPYQRSLLSTIQSRVMPVDIPSAECRFTGLNDLEQALVRLGGWNLQAVPSQLKMLLQSPIDLSKYLKTWLEIYQEQDWNTAKLLQDQLVNPKVQLARKLGVLHFLDELAVDEFNYLEDQIYHLEKSMEAWSDWIMSEGTRKCRSIRQELGDAYRDPYVGDGSKDNLQRFYRGFCLREIESIFTEILSSMESLLISSEERPILPQEKQISLNFEAMKYGSGLYTLSHRLVELRRMLYNNQPWSNLIEQLGMTLIKLKQS